MKYLLISIFAIGFLLSACGSGAPRAATPPLAMTIVASPTAQPTSSPSPSATPTTPRPTPTQTTGPTATAQVAVVTPDAVEAEDISTWATYEDPDYGFSFRYPAERWTPVFSASDELLLSLAYHEMGIALRMKVKRIGEAGDLQLYGGAAGDFVPQGTVMFLGEEVTRSALVYEDITRAIHYNETSPIQRGDLLFSFALVSNRDYAQGAVVPEEVQAEADRIIASFELDEAQAGEVEPAIEGPPVVFIYQHDALARTDVTGSGVQPLTPASGIGDDMGWVFFGYKPQVSPDGRWLLDHTATGFAGDWRLFDVATGELVAKGSGQPRLSTTWSPDSAAFAFLNAGEVCIYSIETASEECAAVADDLIAAVWSPDGASIALAQSDATVACCRGAIWLLDVQSGQAEPIAGHNPPAQAEPDEMIAWLGDGRLLIKAHLDDAAYVYDPQNVAPVTFAETVAGFSPDEQRFLYHSGRVVGPTGEALYALPGNDACPQPLLRGHNWDWSPDGARL
jgi:hypothetical protein